MTGTVPHILKYLGKFHLVVNTVNLDGVENLDKVMTEKDMATAILMLLVTIASEWNQTLTPHRKEE